MTASQKAGILLAVAFTVFVGYLAGMADSQMASTPGALDYTLNHFQGTFMMTTWLLVMAAIIFEFEA